MSSHPTPAVDRDELMARLEGDAELLGELVQLFLDDLDERMQAIAAAVRSSELELLHRESHTLKGSVGNFAATRAFEAAQRLDDLARAGSLEGLAEAHAELVDAMAQTRVELEEMVKKA